jgi:hypothetical protein
LHPGASSKPITERNTAASVLPAPNPATNAGKRAFVLM